MNIIFKEHSEAIEKKHVVLDLDTFSIPDGSIHTVCCVVENIPITELSETENLKALHAGLIASYGQRNWNQCEQAIAQLVGKWGGELDSFYAELKNRIESFKTQPLDHNWTPVIIKN
jgi:hypothetical protein